MTDNILTIDDVKAYLGVDYADDATERNITRMIGVADAYLKGAIGDGYPADDPRAKELALIIISDMYDNRGVSTSYSGATRKLVNSLALQLKMEMRRKNDI